MKKKKTGLGYLRPKGRVLANLFEPITLDGYDSAVFLM